MSKKIKASRAREQKSDFSRVNNLCLIILTSIAVTVALIYARDILVPFVIAVFLYAVASPAISFLQLRWKLPRAASIVIIALSGILLLTGIVLIIASSINTFIDGADRYTARFVEASQWLTRTARDLGVDLDADSIREQVQGLPLFTYVRGLTSQAFSIFGEASLVIIFFLFLIAGDGSASKRSPFVREIQFRVGRYVSAKVITSALSGLAVWMIFLLFGVELAFLFGVLTFLLNFIPNVGALIAFILPIPILFLQFGFGWTTAIVVILSTAIQAVIGNVMEPKMMGESMDLHPVTILIFLMFWGWVWGIPGMFLAVPITAILKIVFSRMENTRALSELLAGRLVNSTETR